MSSRRNLQRDPQLCRRESVHAHANLLGEKCPPTEIRMDSLAVQHAHEFRKAYRVPWPCYITWPCYTCLGFPVKLNRVFPVEGTIEDGRNDDQGMEKVISFQSECGGLAPPGICYFPRLALPFVIARIF